MKKYIISEIATIEKGKQIDTKTLNDSFPYPYLNGGIKESGRYSEFNTDGETITVSEGGASCGYVNYYLEKFWCGTHCYRIKTNKFSSKYLYYGLKANQDKIMGLRTGAAMPNIKASSIKSLSLFLDESHDVQARIVKELDSLTATIEIKEKQLEGFDFLIKSRFRGEARAC